jgi:hypothetical protein
MGVVHRAWPDFLYIARDALLLILPANLALLPYFAHGLIADNRRWYVLLGIGVGLSAVWVGLAALVDPVRNQALPRVWGPVFWEMARFAVIAVLPVAVIFVPLLAFWLGGSVRRAGLYWRG